MMVMNGYYCLFPDVKIYHQPINVHRKAPLSTCSRIMIEVYKGNCFTAVFDLCAEA